MLYVLWIYKFLSFLYADKLNCVDINMGMVYDAIVQQFLQFL